MGLQYRCVLGGGEVERWNDGGCVAEDELLFFNVICRTIGVPHLLHRSSYIGGVIDGLAAYFDFS